MLRPLANHNLKLSPTNTIPPTNIAGQRNSAASADLSTGQSAWSIGNAWHVQQQCISSYSSFKAVSAEIDSGMEPLIFVLPRVLYSSPGIHSQPTALNASPVSKPQYILGPTNTMPPNNTACQRSSPASAALSNSQHGA